MANRTWLGNWQFIAILCWEFKNIFQILDIEPDFKEQLRELVPLLLSPRSLVVKQIGGQKVHVKDMVHYFKAYTAIYKGNELPEPKSMLEATAEANNLLAMAGAKETYVKVMEVICGGATAYLSTAQLEEEHFKAKDTAITSFRSMKKMGGVELSNRYLETLEQVGTLFHPSTCFIRVHVLYN